jgi:hypothetical protein
MLPRVDPDPANQEYKKEREAEWSSVLSSYSWPNVDEENVLGTLALLLVLHKFVGDEFASARALLSSSKRTEMDEDLRSSAVRGDEAEPPIILPVCYAALIAHKASPDLA